MQRDQQGTLCKLKMFCQLMLQNAKVFVLNSVLQEIVLLTIESHKIAVSNTFLKCDKIWKRWLWPDLIIVSRRDGLWSSANFKGTKSNFLVPLGTLHWLFRPLRWNPPSTASMNLPEAIRIQEKTTIKVLTLLFRLFTTSQMQSGKFETGQKTRSSQNGLIRSGCWTDTNSSHRDVMWSRTNFGPVLPV